MVGNSPNGQGVMGVSNGSNGVSGVSTSGYGVYGTSTSGFGAASFSVNSYGVWARSNTAAPLRLVPGSQPASGSIEDLYVDTSGILFIYATGGWTRVGTQ